MQWFLVVQDVFYCLIWARGREDAKRQARPYLGADPDHYEVTPITPEEYRLRAIVFDKVIVDNKHKDF